MLGQGIRFVLVGALVALIYLLVTTVLATVPGVPFQVALTIGFLTAMTVHFTLQRVFVWVSSVGFALPVYHQAWRYLTVAVTQYVITSAATMLLPGVLGLDTETVYVGTVMTIAIANFVLFRHGIFHARLGVDLS